MGLMIENFAVEDTVLLALRFSPISTIPPMIHTHFKFKYRPFYVILAISGIIKYRAFLSASILFLSPSEYVFFFWRYLK